MKSEKFAADRARPAAIGEHLLDFVRFSSNRRKCAARAVAALVCNKKPGPLPAVMRFCSVWLVVGVVGMVRMGMLRNPMVCLLRKGCNLSLLGEAIPGPPMVSGMVGDPPNLTVLLVLLVIGGCWALPRGIRFYN
jgi:hypothetical protein